MEDFGPGTAVRGGARLLAALPAAFRFFERCLRRLSRRSKEISELEHVLLNRHLSRDIGATLQAVVGAEERRAEVIRDGRPR
jgi:hypothetical protein